MNGLKTIIKNNKDEILRAVKEMKEDFNKDMEERKEDFHDWKKEEFAPLAKKVDKIWTKVLLMVGGFAVLNLAAWIVLR